ncbi:hypothetical protein OG607_29725 [Streptomyces sp. NBC_01537]|uniref:DUF7848 domain-containing protein n=1 Tax=Streptomyces sp. NBC_01537 TaxID=2903896 RepID=UPI00386E3E74
MSPTPRTVIRAADWTLRVETAEGAPQAIYSALCITCGAESPAVDDTRLPIEIWTLKHTGLNPSHRQFQPRTLGFWRVDPAPGNPYAERRQRM